jgi:hypothetical protein
MEKPNELARNQQTNAPDAPSTPQKTTREVRVNYLDSPPPSGKREIHPRRPAPIIPTKEEQEKDNPHQD